MEQTPLEQTPAQPQAIPKKRDVFLEIVSGYTLAATIVSFLSIWGMAVYNLSSQNLL